MNSWYSDSSHTDRDATNIISLISGASNLSVSSACTPRRYQLTKVSLASRCVAEFMNSCLIREIHWYLTLPDLCIWTDTHFCTQGENCTTALENIRRHSARFHFQGLLYPCSKRRVPLSMSHVTFRWIHTANYARYTRVYLGWRSGQCTALLVARSRDRSPVVSLGIFSEATDRTMCPGVDSASKNEYQDTPGVKTAGA